MVWVTGRYYLAMLLALSLNALQFAKSHCSDGLGIAVDAFPQGITEEQVLLPKYCSQQQRFQWLLLDQVLIRRKVEGMKDTDGSWTGDFYCLFFFFYYIYIPRNSMHCPRAQIGHTIG